MYWLITGSPKSYIKALVNSVKEPSERYGLEPKSYWEKKYYALLDKYIEKQDKELREAKETISVLEAKELKKIAPSSYESDAQKNRN